jgi:hypothetical protein
MMPRDPMPQLGKTITIDGITVRLVPIPGLERAPCRVRFEIMDGPRVARAMLSCPSADDCHDAIRAARNPGLHLVNEPKVGPFNNSLATSRARSNAKRRRQVVEESVEVETEP